ncbi:MAG: alanine racemase [Gemmatimonadales bacterium]|jgi:D-serine deaminase-like pyridoxal phosphate-dependent protein
MKKHDIDTPALLVDTAALRRNLELMQSLAEGFGVRLRPHTKTHKSPHLARLQVELGASGITVAKVGEAEVMADEGLEDILIANQVIGAEKCQRLAQLAQRVRVAVLVDSAEGVDLLDLAFREAGSDIDVLIEVDTGKGRCGLTDLDEIVALAQRVADAPALRLRGVETHEGHVPSGAQSAGQMEERATSAGQKLVQVAEALRQRGHPVEDVSVGSTPAAPYTAAAPGVTEMRPGTYVFNDVNQMSIGQATPEDCALSVLATVISRPTPDRAVLDAGSKSLFAEPARRAFALTDYDGFGYIREAPAARIVTLNEEHGVVRLPPGTDFPPIGSPVEIIPNHVCPAVNLHEEFHLIDGEDVVEIWPIAARGKVR